VAEIRRRKAAAGTAPRSQWLAYLSVDSVDDAATLVADRGGRVLIPQRQVPSRGAMAVVADPDGVPVGLVRSATGDPADLLAEPGEWIWALYQAQDATRAAAFYQDLAGYEVVRDDGLPAAAHFLLLAEGFARASIVERPADRPERRAAWLYFLRVTDVDEAVRRATALGAQVLVPPRAVLQGDRAAVIADPGGARVGLLEWTEGPGDAP
jgi:predicted enzyme related to lactoylglutathione lyase